MTIAADTPAQIARKKFTRLALFDLWDGLGKWRLWLALGWQDVRQRYRRSILGPFWITASLGVSILALGVIYSKLFHQPIEKYVPMVATGFLVWTTLSAMLNEGCFVFISSVSTIKQLPFPLSTYVYRDMWRNLIVFGHNLIIYLIVIAFFAINPGWDVLLAIPGLVLIVLNGIGWALIFGVFSARFRDVPQLVTNFLQVIYFITPLLWQRSMLGSAAWLVDYNPIAYLIESVRGPLLGNPPSLHDWLITIAITIVNLVVAMVVFVRFRWRIPYWL